MTQIQIFYRTYYIQAENISDYATNHPEMSLEEISSTRANNQPGSINPGEKAVYEQPAQCSSESG